jgi:hypothetical protein
VLAWQAWRRVYTADVGIAFPSIDRWDTIKLDADGGAKRMDGRSVSEMLQRRAAAAGLEGNWTGNSARRGFATVAKGEDVPDEQVMRHGRWRWVENMRMYVESDHVWVGNAVRELGL